MYGPCCELPHEREMDVGDQGKIDVDVNDSVYLR